MNHGTTASLICPACGQAFLSMQHAMEGVAPCPHCAHTAPRAHFGTQSQVAGVVQVRRRVAQAPVGQAALPPSDQAAWPPPQAQAAPQMGVAAMPQQAAPTPWPGTPPLAAPAPAGAHSVARPVLHPSQALMPVHAPPPPAEFTSAPPQLQPATGRRGLLLGAVAAACGIGAWMWWDHANTPLPGPKAAAERAATGTGAAVEIRKAQVLLPALPEPVKLTLEDTQAFAADAEKLVHAFFAATSAEGRAACVHEAAKHGADIEALFGPAAPRKIELRQLAYLPTVVLSLPGARHVPLFKLVTSQCAAGALLRLEMGPDGKRRLFWPLLAETHEGRLAAFLGQGQANAEPAWFYVALRPSHGLDLPAVLRGKYLTFDAQVSAASEPHLVVCVERDTPLGRFMDRESDWGRVSLARLLVHKLEIQADAPCMTVVDCEGAVERSGG